LKRSDDGLWGMPAGSPELGKSLETCIRREVYEETGMTIRTFTVFGMASDPKTETHTYPNGHQIQNFSLLVSSREWSGVPRVNDDEATEVRFFRPEEFPKPEFRVMKEFDSIPLYRKYNESRIFQCT
jgi:8-oxo-dGTP pyrophosphatase MutT (NUDIX family)